MKGELNRSQMMDNKMEKKTQRWDADLSGYYIATPRPALEASRDQMWAEQRPLMVSSNGRGAYASPLLLSRLELSDTQVYEP